MSNIWYDLKPLLSVGNICLSASEEVVFLMNMLFVWGWQWSPSFFLASCATCLKQHLFQGIANVWNLNEIGSISLNLYCYTLTSTLQENLTPSSAAGNRLYSVSQANKKSSNPLICTKARVSTADIWKQIRQKFQRHRELDFHIGPRHLGRGLLFDPAQRLSAPGDSCEDWQMVSVFANQTCSKAMTKSKGYYF